jgi:predicted phage-related endonuclease
MNLVGERTDKRLPRGRRSFIGGSDARIIMGTDEAALLRLWQEKRGEVEPEDLSGNLIVQLGVTTEDLNRRWFELNTGQIIKDQQRHAVHPPVRWMAATLDGVVEATGAVFEAKFTARPTVKRDKRLDAVRRPLVFGEDGERHCLLIRNQPPGLDIAPMRAGPPVTEEPPPT